jgi:hypothetical protein
VGFTAAFVIFLSTDPVSDRPVEQLEDSKKYLRQMEVYGGTANVLASEAREWLEGLWHGRRLAMTIACSSFLAAGVSFLALKRLQPDAGKQDADRDGRRPVGS